MSDLPRHFSAIHESYNEKKISPAELTQNYLSNAKSSRHNAVLTLCEERAMDRAKSLEKILKSEGSVPQLKMPLFGIPLGIKDVLNLSGVRTTCGSKILENYIAPYSATCLERLENAGAIILGKLNMDEFAMGGSNENSAYGSVLHPTHSDRVPGGSSGGSATAVRAQLCAGALGSDTGGSVRLPANYCGIVGMKPTYGRISRFGLVAFASSLDQVGPMANSVRDVASLLEVMASHDSKDSTSSPKAAGEFVRQSQAQADWKKLKVGIPKEYWIGGLSPDVQKSLGEALTFFKAKGATLVDISLPHTEYAVAVYYIVAVSEASSNLARFDGVRYGVRPQNAKDAGDLIEFYEKVRAQFGAEVKRRIILGTFALSSGYYDAYYLKACQVRRKIAEDFELAFKKVDLIATPVSPTTAFKLGEKVTDPLQMYLNDIFTIPVNLAGLPALSVPCGQDQSGLPIGLQLIGPAFGDEKLLQVANGFEKERSE